MASAEDIKDRHVVPRLRTFAVARRMGELAPMRQLETDPFSDDMLQEAIGDFEAAPGVSVAADLVSSAIVLGRNALARDAALFLLSRLEAPPAARQMAARCIGIEDSGAVANVPEEPQPAYAETFRPD